MNQYPRTQKEKEREKEEYPSQKDSFWLGKDKGIKIRRRWNMSVSALHLCDFLTLTLLFHSLSLYQ
jgi:hypothetical protein